MHQFNQFEQHHHNNQIHYHNSNNNQRPESNSSVVFASGAQSTGSSTATVEPAPESAHLISPLNNNQIINNNSSSLILSTSTTAATAITTGQSIQQQQQILVTPQQASATTLKTVLSQHHKQLAHRLSMKYHRIKTVYNLNRFNLTKAQLSIDLEEILSEIDRYTLDWRKHSIDCLKLISESPNCTNIIITKLPLVIAFGHIICLGLGQFFQIDQVYSSNKTNKEACIKRIKKRFGATNRCSYIIVGDRDDVEMAKRLDLPSWTTSRSDGHRQLLQLYTALKEGYLM